MVTKAERAIAACLECADALEALPFRRTALFGPMTSITGLRAEAKYIEDITKAFAAFQDEAGSMNEQVEEIEQQLQEEVEGPSAEVEKVVELQ